MLTPTQLTAIDQHLRKENWLLNEDLLSELTDHYINGISDRLAQGMTFEMALRELHTGFGGRKGLLKMEEEYQVQNYQKLGQLEWQLIRSFMDGSRRPITAGLFIGLYILNTYFGVEDMVKTGLAVAFLFVTSSVLFSIAKSIFFFYKNRNEVSQAVMQPSSPVFVIAYLLSMSLLLVNKYGLAKYGLSLPALVMLSLQTLLETLCLVYYTAIVLSLKQVLRKSLNSRLPKSA
ncbi:hypothetical protein [Spirosoma linguale]|uniref:Uncharacterized protein n=1 Tax=Spirosoma linguale (strain ATCC 33905 / DSM 74 / LMG 10896 / Claus 1) TaxID=504472 RepID=D2QUI5_SPILD|nr:hypothetical protein Slin_6510 [Spirosoma linguale DSM 74]